MLTFQVLLLNGSSSDELRLATLNSIVFAASDEKVLIESEQAQISGLVESSSADVIHIVTAGAIILPEFYRAMLTELEYTNKDYSVCHLGMLSQKTTSKVGDSGFEISQMLVRKWIYQEIGIGDSVTSVLASRVIGEYRGCEVPCVLCMRI